uniref:ZMYM2-like/QRICH1 C-terminal domain-containing protein n=1 Tax=Amphimedon queenslandica TaxID=400682 RepID=A0A1X7VAL7_AMPQE
MRVQILEYTNLLKKDDSVFNKFQTTLDNLFKILRTGGVGSDYSPTKGISLEDEKKLQRKGNPDRYIYTKNSSKNEQGGLKQVRLDYKVVTVVANSKIGDRCPVYILHNYISKLPDKAQEMDLFYCRVYPKLPKNPNDPRYIAAPIGKKTLSTMICDMCLKAGVGAEKSNHSLRVAGTSSLFAAGVPEKLIQSRTGHVSLTALRKYGRITDEQELAVSKILTGDDDTYEKALKCSKDMSMTLSHQATMFLHLVQGMLITLRIKLLLRMQLQVLATITVH